MARRSKRYIESIKIVDNKKKYEVRDAIKLLKSFRPAKFDESVEVAIKLDIDPKAVRPACERVNFVAKRYR